MNVQFGSNPLALMFGKKAEQSQRQPQQANDTQAKVREQLRQPHGDTVHFSGCCG